RERRQVRVHHHRGNVAELQVRARRNRHAELGEHVPQALRRERRLRRLVARAVEADDEAVAHQLVRAHARDGGEILDAFLGARAERRGVQRAERHEQTDVRYEAARGGREAQNGHSGLEKKRLSQPGTLDDATTPVPPYATCASAICVESTVLSGAISTGRTMPRKRIYSSPWLMRTHFSPCTTRLPFGSTFATVTAIEPSSMLLCAAPPWPSKLRVPPP